MLIKMIVGGILIAFSVGGNRTYGHVTTFVDTDDVSHSQEERATIRLDNSQGLFC